MFQRTLGIGCIGSVLLLGLAACTLPDALQQREAPLVYILDPQRKPAAAQTPARQKPKIAVTVPQAWPGFGTVEIAYTRIPNRLEYYAHSEWADTPAQMIGPLLVRALEDSGRFSAVVAPGRGLSADIRLDTEIVKMQQEFHSAPSIGRVVLRAQLVDLPTGRVLGTRTFEAAVPAPSDDPAGAVASIDDALSIVFDQILAYCLELVAAETKKKR